MSVWALIALAAAILAAAIGLFAYAVDNAVKQVPSQLDLFGRKPSIEKDDEPADYE